MNRCVGGGAGGGAGQGPWLAGKRQSTQRFQSGFVRYLPSREIPLFTELQKLALAFQYPLCPRLHRGELGMASQVGLVKSYRGPRHEVRRTSFPFLQPDETLWGPTTFTAMPPNLFDSFPT